MSKATRILPLLIRLLIWIGCLLMPVVARAAPEPVEPELRIAMLQFRPAELLNRQWQPTLAYLAERLPGYRIRLLTMTHAEIDRAVASGQVHFVFTNPAHYVQLEREESVSRIATLMRARKGIPLSHFGGAIVVRADRDDLRSLADLRGRTIAAPGTDPSILGGYLAPAFELQKHGIDPLREVRIEVTGLPLDRVIKAVLEGSADAGFVRAGLLEELSDAGQLDSAALRVLGPRQHPGFPFATSTDLYPEWPLASTRETDPLLATRVAAALFSLPPGGEVARAGDYHAWVVPPDYAPVHEMLRAMWVRPYDTAEHFGLGDIARKYPLQLLALALGGLGLLGLLLLRARHAHRNAERTRERLQVTLNSIGDAVLATDLNGRITFISPIAQNLTGWHDDEALGQPIERVVRLFEPDSRTLRPNPALGALERPDELPLYSMSLLETRDGRLIPVEDSASPIRGNRHDRLQGALLVLHDRSEAERQLDEIRASRRLLQDFIDRSPALIYAFDLDGRLTMANQQIAELLGQPLEALLGRQRESMYPEELARHHATGDRLVVASGESLTSEEKSLDGQRIYLSVRFPLTDAEGRINGVGCVSTDITERKRQQERLELSASVFEHALEAIIIADANSVLIDANPAFTRITGYAREEVIGKTTNLLKSGVHDVDFYRQMWQAVTEQGYWHGEIWNRRKNGELYPELLTICAVRDARGLIRHYIGIFSDISSMKEQQRRLEQMAHYDALTQLPNRLLLADRLLQALAQARRNGRMLAVCYLDLDGFKPINDSWGHQVGDRVLIAMAQRFRGALRASDTVARLGGDEFVLLFGDLESEGELNVLLERVLRMVCEPINIDNLVLSLSCSIGVTLFPDDDADPDTLLRHADQAMYLAKQAGRNRYHIFDPEHDRRLLARNAIISRVREGLQNDEFLLYYQPKVDMRRGRVIGAEALIRWQHPERGLLTPAAFLREIEQSEFSTTLGEWVLDHAIAQLERWWRQGLQLSVSINISGTHLLDKHFAAGLAQRLQRHPDVPPEAVELEVLETAALEDIARVSSVMSECKALGVRFSLDDFGTGYSSLTYFRRLPADVLKIDQTFVRNMLSDSEDLAIIEGVIGLTEAFRRQVIAEGVETLQHGVMLLQLGCDLAQGYAIARPMPAEALPGWVATYRQPAIWQETAGIPWTREDISLLNAELDHQRWVDELLAFTRNGGLPPPMDEHQCRFGRWLDETGRQRYGRLAAFPSVVPLHHQVHQLGREMVALVQAGRAAEAQSHTDALLGLRDQLIGTLNKLLAEISQREAAGQ